MNLQKTDIKFTSLLLFFKGRELGGYEIRVGWGKPVPGSKLTTPLPVLSNLPVNFFEMFFHI